MGNRRQHVVQTHHDEIKTRGGRSETRDGCTVSQVRQKGGVHPCHGDETMAETLPENRRNPCRWLEDMVGSSSVKYCGLMPKIGRRKNVVSTKWTTLAFKRSKKTSTRIFVLSPTRTPNQLEDSLRYSMTIRCC